MTAVRSRTSTSGAQHVATHFGSDKTKATAPQPNTQRCLHCHPTAFHAVRSVGVLAGSSAFGWGVPSAILARVQRSCPVATKVGPSAASLHLFDRPNSGNTSPPAQVTDPFGVPALLRASQQRFRPCLGALTLCKETSGLPEKASKTADAAHCLHHVAVDFLAETVDVSVNCPRDVFLIENG